MCSPSLPFAVSLLNLLPFRKSEHHQKCPIRLGKFSRMRNYSISKTATAELGWARPACSSITTCAASEPRLDLSSQRCCLLRLKLLLHAGGSTGKRKLVVEFVTTKRLVCKNGHSLVEPPSRVFYTVSVSACLFVGEGLFQNFYGRPLPSTSPFTLFARSTEPQVVVLPLSHGLGRGENLVTIARFAKPLFAKMHHHVHAVAGALRKPNVAHLWPV